MLLFSWSTINGEYFTIRSSDWFSESWKNPIITQLSLLVILFLYWQKFANVVHRIESERLCARYTVAQNSFIPYALFKIIDPIYCWAIWRIYHDVFDSDGSDLMVSPRNFRYIYLMKWRTHPRKYNGWIVYFSVNQFLWIVIWGEFLEFNFLLNAASLIISINIIFV